MVEMKAASLPVDVGVLEGVQDAPPAQLVLLRVEGGDQQVWGGQNGWLLAWALTLS